MSLKLRGEIWWWRKTINGVPFMKSTKSSDRKVAEQVAALFEADAIKSVVLKGETPKLLHSVLDAFLKEREGSKGYKSAKVHIDRFYALPNLRMDQLKDHHPQSIIDKRREEGAAHNTLSVSTSYWNAVCNFCTEKKWTSGPRLARLEPIQTKPYYLTLAQEAQLLAELDPDAKYHGKNPRLDANKRTNRDLLVTLLDLGCRYSEAGEMRWEQVDLEKRTVLVLRKKNGVDNTLRLTNRLYEVLQRRWSEASTDLEKTWVFPSKRRWNNVHWLQDALRRAGLRDDARRISIHSCRHAFASRMVAAGLSIIEVQTLLGHKSVSSTMIYSHLEVGVVTAKAVEVLNRLEAGAV